MSIKFEAHAGVVWAVGGAHRARCLSRPQEKDFGPLVAVLSLLNLLFFGRLRLFLLGLHEPGRDLASIKHCTSPRTGSDRDVQSSASYNWAVRQIGKNVNI